MFYPNAFDKKYNSRETAYAQTKYQESSTHGFGARAPYLTMFPGFHGTNSLLSHTASFRKIPLLKNFNKICNRVLMCV